MAASAVRECDVCVVGAGAAGLACARRLVATHGLGGVRVVILEARERVGGRTHSVSQDGTMVDIGGQWVGPTQQRVLQLLNELRLTIMHQEWFGYASADAAAAAYAALAAARGVSARSGSVAAREELALSQDPGSLALKEEEKRELAGFLTRLDTLGLELDVSAPWAHPRAVEWDSENCAQVISRELKTEGARREMVLAVQTILACEPEEVSFLFLLFFARAAGGFLLLADGPGGSQSFKLVQGAQALSNALAADLRARGVDIILESPVERVQQLGVDGVDGCLVESTLARVRARRVVFAMSPTLVSTLRFSPPLPEDRRRLGETMTPGRVIKVIVVYDGCFWEAPARATHTAEAEPHAAGGQKGRATEEKEAKAQVRRDEDAEEENDEEEEDEDDDNTAQPLPLPSWLEPNPVFNWFVSSVGGRPALVGLIVGRMAKLYSTAGEHITRQAVLAQLFATFESPAALAPVALLIKDWVAEPLTAGCYATLMGPGVLTRCGAALRRPFGAVHWAGTETAMEWSGYIEGAVESGYRAADEVARALAKPALRARHKL